MHRRHGGLTRYGWEAEERECSGMRGGLWWRAAGGAAGHWDRPGRRSDRSFFSTWVNIVRDSHPTSQGLSAVQEQWELGGQA